MTGHIQRLLLAPPASPLATVLGERLGFRAVAELQIRALISGAPDPVVLLADAAHASIAITLAGQYSERLHALILVSPPALEDAAHAESAKALSGGAVAVLVVHGSRLPPSQEPARAFAYKQEWPQAQLVYVYDAGEAIASERPGALTELIGDFIQYQEGFVINRQSTAISP